ncbi:MAG: 2-oxoglutarate dehydrogenase E1 component, partial [Paracoccaceae bacterium]|nr:2-oxoglutarate dehydrogenase E1 component [Paracoccaceae bacterium]
MARQEANEAFRRSSFLYGGNAAYLEELYARYQENPASLDASWQDFFKELKDDKADVLREVRGAPWRRPDWPIPANGELVSAFDGDWQQVERHVIGKIQAKAQVNGADLSQDEMLSAARDSVRAIMMIRAYRMRGHLHADLDPLGIAALRDHEELHPHSYGFTEADYDRKIFLDMVLGLDFATIPQMLEILRRTYCSTLGVEFMHISDPAEKGWIQQRIEGPDKEISFTVEGKKAILNKLI